MRSYLNTFLGSRLKPTPGLAAEAGAGSAASRDGLSRAARPAKRMGLSVRTKGVIVFAALIAYAVVISVFVFHEKNLLMHDFEEIQASLKFDSLLRQADTAAFHAAMAVFANADERNPQAAMHRVQMHYEILRNKHAVLKRTRPQLEVSMDKAEAAFTEVSGNMTPENLQRLLDELVKVKNAYTALAEKLAQVHNGMSERYRARTDSLAMTTLLLGAIGFGIFGTIMTLFFRQLTVDLRTLQARSIDIVNGYRGAPIPVRRKDEVGQLMAGVNSMATILDKREKELIVERQKYLHQEKMAAIGALAAGVAHEIGNPVAAIAGIAQDMAEHHAQGGECGDGNPQCRPDLILAQTERLAAITREISEFASPQPAEPQLMDLNALLRSTSSLLRYDKRLSTMALRLELDRGLPAIHGVGDQLMQLVMNVLVNAMDALETVPDRRPEVVISTRVEGGRAVMTVADNGPGMDAETASRAFEAFFTTKPAGKGTGLGLSLCYSIMKNHGGSIEIDSAPGAGTRVHVYFPINEIA